MDATMLIFFQIFPTLHISQNQCAHAYQFWDFALLPLETEPHL